MSDLALLRSFLGVYRAGTVGRAADQLTLAQPTVTAHLKSLETQLGRELFERQPRGMRPLPAAHELASAVAEHLDVLDAVLYDDVVGRTAQGGVLYVGGPSEFIGLAVLPALAPLVARGVRVRTMLDTNEPLLDALIDGTLDLAVLTRPIEHSGLELETLDHERPVLVAALPRARRIGKVSVDRAGAQLLAEQPMIGFTETLDLVREFWRTVFRTRFTGSPSVVVESLPIVADLVGRDMGIAVLPMHVCRQRIAAGELRLLVNAEASPRQTLYLAWRSGSGAGHLAQQARTLLHESIAASHV